MSTERKAPHANALVGLDWQDLIEDNNCPTHGQRGPDVELAEGRSVQYADITGDGAKEALIAASCATTTSANPVAIYVYGGSSSAAKPTRLAKILGGAKPYLRDVNYTVSGSSVAIKAQEISSTAARCCPDMSYEQNFRWDGKKFIGETPERTPSN